MKDILQYRMYFFVPYNISSIQKGIQAGHAALRYARKYAEDKPIVWDFVDNHETWIILNGGTTNKSCIDNKPIGTLNQIFVDLYYNNIDHSTFYEPDLNDALTAICFICDERVFNYKDYPDFNQYIIENKFIPQSSYLEVIEMLNSQPFTLIQEIYPEYYNEWVEFLGGKKNVFLRELIRNKKLA